MHDKKYAIHIYMKNGLIDIDESHVKCCHFLHIQIIYNVMNKYYGCFC